MPAIVDYFAGKRIKVLPKHRKDFDDEELQKKFQKWKGDSKEVTSICIKGYAERITKIPNVVGMFVNISWIDLRGNSILEIPWSIVYLKELRYLNVKNNQISDLPKTIGTLQNLREINLENNNLKFLSIEILKLTDLKILNVRNNPMESPSQTVCSQGLEEIKKSLQRRLTRYDLWEDSTPWVKNDLCGHINLVKSLANLCFSTIIELGPECIEIMTMPVMLRSNIKTYQSKMTLLKCNKCKNSFTSKLTFNVHTCKGDDPTGFEPTTRQKLQATLVEKKESLSAILPASGHFQSLFNRDKIKEDHVVHVVRFTKFPIPERKERHSEDRRRVLTVDGQKPLLQCMDCCQYFTKLGYYDTHCCNTRITVKKSGTTN